MKIFLTLTFFKYFLEFRISKHNHLSIDLIGSVVILMKPIYKRGIRWIFNRNAA